ncbi:hypothetical protein BGX27_008764 [Mortierella sp. AM989]|nr:hypothetical protein BGX27_008764 [Mortierella sp. AM989]
MSHRTLSTQDSRHHEDDVDEVIRLRIVEKDTMAGIRGEAEGPKHSFAVRFLIDHPSQHQQNHQIDISSMEVSADGKYAATISYFLVEGIRMAQVDLWDISSLSRGPLMQQDIRSVGSNRFKISVSTSLKVAISPTGSLLAVYEIPPDAGADHGVSKSPGHVLKEPFPLRVYRFDNGSTAISIQEEKESLTELTLPHNSVLSTFTGFCRFFPNNHQDSDSILVTCDGLNMDVFNILNFKILYSISLQDFFTLNTNFSRSKDDQSNACKATQWMMHDLDSKFFGRDIDYDTVSIWNWRTGSNLCYLDVPVQETQDQGLRRVLFSKSGTLVVVAGSFNSISSYFTASGICVSQIEIKGIKIDFLQAMDHGRLLLIGKQDGKIPVSRIYDMTCLHNFIELEPLSMDGIFDLRILTDNEAQDGSFGRIILSHGPKVSVMELRAIESNQRESSESCLVGCNILSTTVGHGNPSNILEIAQDGTINCEDSTRGYVYKISIENGATKFTLFRRMKQDVDWVELLSENAMSTNREEIRYSDAKDDANDRVIKIIFLPCKTRFVVVRGRTTQLWELPSVSQGICRLLVLSIIKNLSNEYVTANVCIHGKSLRLEVKESGQVKGHGIDYVDISGTSAHQMSNEQTVASIESIPFMLRSFKGSNLQYQQAMTEFVMQRINQCRIITSLSHVPTDKPPVLCRSAMAQVIDHYHRRNSDTFLAAILNYSGNSVWIPHWSTADPRDIKLILFLLENSKMKMAQQLIDYCIRKAHQSHPGYIDFLTETLQLLRDKFPEVSKDIARRSAFIPASNHRFMVLNAITNGPQWRLRFWKGRKTNLHEFERPVFQLQSQLPVTVLPTASDLARRRSSKFPPQPPARDIKHSRLNSNIELDFYVVPVSLVYNTVKRTQGMEFMGEAEISTWQSKSLAYSRKVWHVINFTDAPRIYDHFSDLDIFDNPAIAAIEEYKWTRIARTPWIRHFLCKLAYALLVLGVSLQQIYRQGVITGQAPNAENGTAGELIVEYTPLTGTFITMIVAGYLLLHLEFHQLKLDPSQYISIILLINPNNTHGDQIFSYAILFTYNHILSELRVLKGINRVFTIIVSIIKQIFLVLLVGFVLIWAFTHGLIHLTQMDYQSKCPTFSDPTIAASHACEESIPGFPKSFAQGIFTTYFFTVGVFDDVQNELSGSFPAQFMLMVFTLMATLLMLNVLIAFMNWAYEHGHEISSMVWLQNRLDLIITTENLIRFVPNYHLDHDHFPKYVIYTATEEEIKEYRKLYKIKT